MRVDEGAFGVEPPVLCQHPYSSNFQPLEGLKYPSLLAVMYVIFNNTTKIPLLNLIPGVEGHTALSTSPPFWLPVMPKSCYL